LRAETDAAIRAKVAEARVASPVDVEQTVEEFEAETARLEQEAADEALPLEALLEDEGAEITDEWSEWAES
jgi:hypothetical protein